MVLVGKQIEEARAVGRLLILAQKRIIDTGVGIGAVSIAFQRFKILLEDHMVKSHCRVGLIAAIVYAVVGMHSPSLVAKRLQIAYDRVGPLHIQATERSAVIAKNRRGVAGQQLILRQVCFTDCADHCHTVGGIFRCIKGIQIAAVHLYGRTCRKVIECLIQDQNNVRVFRSRSQHTTVLRRNLRCFLCRIALRLCCMVQQRTDTRHECERIAARFHRGLPGLEANIVFHFRTDLPIGKSDSCQHQQRRRCCRKPRPAPCGLPGPLLQAGHDHPEKDQLRHCKRQQCQHLFRQRKLVAGQHLKRRFRVQELIRVERTAMQVNYIVIGNA